MSNDPVGNSAASESVSSDDIAPNTNYSRWMTGMASEIAHLKLYQLAIPGAHNSGVDRSGKFHIGNKFAACQYDSFPQQLSAGARYLDLRLVDSSYKKTIGNKFPTYRFIEIFEFKHGGISAGRRLEHLVEAVNSFAAANPLEIIFIDFHHYDRGRNHSNDSLQRCLPKFNPIKNRLIPRSASDLSIGEIRQKHPGCNIVLCLAHNYPVPSGNEQDKWPNGAVRREQIWHPLQHEWRPDTSESDITSLVVNSMKSPPENYFWVLSAAVTEQTFPKDLPTTSPVRTEVFKHGFQNANIVMVDFIDGSNSKASVTDRCINLNRQRASDRTSPPAPSRLVVTTKDEETIGGKFQNTLVFHWSQAPDNLGVRRYEIYCNGEKFASTSKMPYEHKNLPLKNYSFKVKAIDCVDNHSEFSFTFDLIQDSIPPTIPGNLELRLGFDGSRVDLVWDHSTDARGIAGYEIYLDNEFLQYVPYKPTNRAFTTIYNLTNTKQYKIQVRAKDNSELHSEFATITLYPRPTVVNPRYSIVGYDELTEKYSVNIVWDIDAYSSPEIRYTGETKWYSGYAEYRKSYRPEPGERPTFNFQASQHERITHRCMTFYERYPTSLFISFDFVFDSTPPAPTNNLKVTSRTQSATSISWAPSTSTNVTSYAISVNEEIPVLVSKSVNTYTFEQMPLDETFSIEVWAINNVDACSIIETLTIESVDNVAPDKPGVPTITNITNSGAQISWTPASDNVAVTGYTITINNNPPISTAHTQHTLTELEEATRYAIDIRAFDAAGNLSPPASASFETKDATAPGKPGIPVITNISHNSATITWTPASDNVAVAGYTITINNKPPISTTRTQHTLTELEEATQYAIEIKAFDAAGNISPPASASFETKDATAPGKPGIPVITNISQNSATITWTPASDNVAVTGYTITINNKPPISTAHTQHTLTELEEATQYAIEIKAFDAAGNSSTSASASFRTKARPTPPRELSYRNLTSASVKLSWLASSDDGWVAGYQVFRDGTSLRMVDSTTYDAYWLSLGRTYLFEVRTKDNEGYFSEPARLQVTTPEESTPPGPVQNLNLNTTYAPTLLWRPPATGAAIQYIVSKDDQQWRAIPGSPNPQCRIELPAAGENYLYEVRAGNMSDQFSEPVAIRIGFAPPHVLHLRDVTKTSFRLVWDAPLGAVGITGYQLTLDDAPPFIVAETQHIFTGLTRAGNYTVTVKTQNESGELSEPTWLDLYIQVNAPSAPQNFRYTQPADAAILEWDAPSEPVTRYRVTLVNPLGKEFNYLPSETTMRERLPSRTRYEVRIVANNDEGPSRPLISEFTTM